MKYLPIFMNIRDRACLVVGGGEIATRKVALLLEAGAEVTVMSPELSQTLQQWLDEDKISRQVCPFAEDTDISQYRIVIAATNNAAINQLISDKARASNTPVNVVDNPDAGIRTRMEAGPEFQNRVIWTPTEKGNRHILGCEPITCSADMFNMDKRAKSISDKANIIILRPGEEKTLNITVWAETMGPAALSASAAASSYFHTEHLRRTRRELLANALTLPFAAATALSAINSSN